MPLYIYPLDNDFTITPVTAGGTGADNIVDAADNLNAIPLSLINQPGGVAGVGNDGAVDIRVTNITNRPTTLVGFGITDAVSIDQLGAPNGYLPSDANNKADRSYFYTGPYGLALVDSNGHLYPDYFPESVKTNPVPTVDGPSTMYASTSGTFTITNYDQFLTYNITPVLGTLTRSGAVITYTAGASEGTGGFIINGRAINVTITASGLVTPSVTSPANGATGISQQPTFTSTAFAYYGAVQTHAQSRWEISASNDFATLVDFYEGASNLTSWQSSVSLTSGNTYYVRVRHRGNLGGWSVWSNVVTFQVIAFQGWATGINDSVMTRTLAITTDNQGNVYTASTREDTSLVDKTPTRKMIITKWSNTGNQVWQRELVTEVVQTFQTAANTTAAYFALNYYCDAVLSFDSAGYLNVFVGRLRDFGYSQGSSSYSLLRPGGLGWVKLDQNGNFIIQKMLSNGNIGYMFGTGADQNNNQYFACIGTSNLPTTGGPTFDGYLDSKKWFSETGYIAKVNGMNSMIWSKQVLSGTSGQFNSTGYEDCLVLSDGTMYAVGFESSFYSVASDNSYKTNGLISKYDTNGNPIWHRAVYANSFVRLYSIAIGPDGYLYVTGEIITSLGGQRQFYLAKINSAGSVIWERSLSSGLGDVGKSVVVDAANGIYVTGHCGNNATGQDALITKWSSGGALIWQKRFGGGGAEFNTSVHLSANQFLYAGGSGFTNTVDSKPDALLTNVPLDGTVTLGPLPSISTMSWMNSALVAATPDTAVYSPTLTVLAGSMTLENTTSVGYSRDNYNVQYPLYGGWDKVSTISLPVVRSSY